MNPAQEQVEHVPANSMGSVYLMNSGVSPGLMQSGGVGLDTTGMCNETPTLLRFPTGVGLSVPWQHRQPFQAPLYFRHTIYPQATTTAVDGDLFSTDCGDFFGQGGDFYVPAAFQQQISDESLYPGQFTPPPQPSYSTFNWTLPYGPDEDKMRQLSFGADGDQLGSLSEPQSQSQQVNTGRSGIRVRFMGPAEIGLRQRARCRIAGSGQLQAQPTTSAPGHVQQLAQTSFARLDGDVVEVEVSTSSQSGGQGPGSERVTFNSIEEALASIETPSLEKDDLHSGQPELVGASRRHLVAHAAEPPVQSVRTPALRVADEKQEEVIKAAKSLFSKRTRTLYHWLYPDTSKTKLKATVSAAWDTLADTEKQFYLSQVLGRFGLQASSLMINPQLDGIKGLPTTPSHSPGPTPVTTAAPTSAPQLKHHHHHHHNHSTSEAQQAVDHLFASCEDADTWTSYAINPPCSGCPATQSTPEAPADRQKPRALCGQVDRRKRVARARIPQLGMLAPDQLDEEVTILKRMREAKLEAELEDDAELSSELEKFRLLAQDGDRPVSCRDGDDFWRRTPDPEDIFTQLDF